MTEKERAVALALSVEEDAQSREPADTLPAQMPDAPVADPSVATQSPAVEEEVPEPVASEAEAEAIAQAVLDEVQPSGELEMTLEELATMGLAESVLWVVRALDLDPMLHSDPLVRHVASKLASSLSLRVERKNLGPQFHST